MSIILRTSNLIISGNTSFTREKIKTINVGENHTLFLTDYGRVYGCGDNKYGQLGSTINNDTTIANPVPTNNRNNWFFTPLKIKNETKPYLFLLYNYNEA